MIGPKTCAIVCMLLAWNANFPLAYGQGASSGNLLGIFIDEDLPGGDHAILLSINPSSGVVSPITTLVTDSNDPEFAHSAYDSATRRFFAVIEDNAVGNCLFTFDFDAGNA